MRGLPIRESNLDRGVDLREAEAGALRGATGRLIDPIRRHLAIVDQSPLRRECLKLALQGESLKAACGDLA